MPIRMLLKDDHWFGPEDIAGLTEAFEGALSKLGLVNRDDPTTLTVAKLIIHWVGPRCPEYESGCAVCYMWAIYDKLAKYTRAATGLLG